MADSIDQVDLSEEVQEIIGQPPKWITRWGISILAALIILMLIGAYFFKYPIIVSTSFTLTTVNPPVPLFANSTGRIVKWFVKDHDIVRDGEIIAILESTSSLESIQHLETFLNSSAEDWKTNVVNNLPPNLLPLGEIDEGYTRFKKAYTNLNLCMSNSTLLNKISITKERIRNQEASIELSEKQWQIKLQEFQLAKESFALDSIAYLRGYGTTKVDFHRAIQTFLSQKSAVLSMEGTIRVEKFMLLEMKESLAELLVSREDEIKSHIQTLEESYLTLNSQIREWYSKYAFVSPIDGRITLTNFWSENQTIISGNKLATIIPTQETVIIARSYIPASALGRVETGQSVNIKLSGFPYTQYGILRGRITSISLVPEKEGYVAEIALEKGMSSTYNETLKFVHQMDGIAEIITHDSRLLKRLINIPRVN
jgi:multidrug efflux pump subunit AcrA (membrane-fusion protein)